MPDSTPYRSGDLPLESLTFAKLVAHGLEPALAYNLAVDKEANRTTAKREARKLMNHQATKTNVKYYQESIA